MIPLVPRCLVAVAAAVVLIPSCDGKRDEPVQRTQRQPVQADSTRHPGLSVDSLIDITIRDLSDAGGHRSRVVFTEGNSWAEEYILQRMKGIGAEGRRQSFDVVRQSGGRVTLSNVLARVTGSSDSCIAIVAHLDACANRDPGWKKGWRKAHAPGADDNATGVAVLLELLRRTLQSTQPPRYTMIFAAVNAEERNPDYGGEAGRHRHHLGSRSLADWLLRTEPAIRCALTIDMIGWHPSRDQVRLFSSIPARSIAEELKNALATDGSSLVLGGPVTHCPYSDNESFERVGVPSLLIMEACRPWRSEGNRPRNRWYHTAGDVPERVRLSMVVATTNWIWAWIEWMRTSAVNPGPPPAVQEGPGRDDTGQ